MKHKRHLKKQYNKTATAHSRRILVSRFTHRLNGETGLFEKHERYEYYRTFKWGKKIILDYNDFRFYPISGAMRSIRTRQEIAQAYYSRFDDDECGLIIERRACRSNAYLSSWALEKIASMADKRSWKMAYKCRKQWEINL